MARHLTAAEVNASISGLLDLAEELILELTQHCKASIHGDQLDMIRKLRDDRELLVFDGDRHE